MTLEGPLPKHIHESATDIESESGISYEIFRQISLIGEKYYDNYRNAEGNIKAVANNNNSFGTVSRGEENIPCLKINDFFDYSGERNAGQCHDLRDKFVSELINAGILEEITNEIPGAKFYCLNGTGPDHFSQPGSSHEWLSIVIPDDDGQLNDGEYIQNNQIIIDPLYGYIGKPNGEYVINLNIMNWKREINPHESDHKYLFQEREVTAPIHDKDVTKSDNVSPLIFGLTSDGRYTVGLSVGFVGDLIKPFKAFIHLGGIDGTERWVYTLSTEAEAKLITMKNVNTKQGRIDRDSIPENILGQELEQILIAAKELIDNSNMPNY